MSDSCPHVFEASRVEVYVSPPPMPCQAELEMALFVDDVYLGEATMRIWADDAAEPEDADA